MYVCVCAEDHPKAHGQAAVTGGSAVMCSVLQDSHAYDGRDTSVPGRGQVLHVPLQPLTFHTTLPPTTKHPPTPLNPSGKPIQIGSERRTYGSLTTAVIWRGFSG